MKIKMKLKKSTKNTHVFEAVDNTASIPTIYIKRNGLSKTPNVIEVEFKEVVE